MKVVLFCGGLGMRLRDYSDLPKPLVEVGERPILWHLMRYYAHFGHKEFILCLGYRGDMVRDYFLRYEEAMTNDFTLYGADRRVELHSHDVADWKISFVDTGLHTNIGQRLLRVRKFVEDDETFLANYSDGLSDLPIDRQIREFRERGVVASVAVVPNPQSFHAVNVGDDGMVSHFGTGMPGQPFRINGGFFVLGRQIFDYIREGEELVEQPFARLIAERQLTAFRWDGFWQGMDTLKDKIAFDRMEARGDCPWMAWSRHPCKHPG